MIKAGWPFDIELIEKKSNLADAGSVALNISGIAGFVPSPPPPSKQHIHFWRIGNLKNLL